MKFSGNTHQRPW